MKIGIAYRANDAFRGYIPGIIKTLKKEDHEVKEVFFAELMPQDEVRKHIIACAHLIPHCDMYFSDSVCAVAKFKGAINIDWLKTISSKTTELEIFKEFEKSAGRPL